METLLSSLFLSIIFGLGVTLFYIQRTISKNKDREMTPEDYDKQMFGIIASYAFSTITFFIASLVFISFN